MTITRTGSLVYQRADALRIRDDFLRIASDARIAGDRAEAARLAVMANHWAEEAERLSKLLNGGVAR